MWGPNNLQKFFVGVKMSECSPSGWDLPAESQRAQKSPFAANGLESSKAALALG